MRRNNKYYNMLQSSLQHATALNTIATMLALSVFLTVLMCCFFTTLMW